MTVRAMNAAARSGKYVIAFYVLDGHKWTARITAARTKEHQIQVKCLNSGKWGNWLGESWIVR